MGPGPFAQVSLQIHEGQFQKCPNGTGCQSQGKQSETQWSVRLRAGRAEGQWERPSEVKTGEARERTLKEKVGGDTLAVLAVTVVGFGLWEVLKGTVGDAL